MKSPSQILRRRACQLLATAALPAFSAHAATLYWGVDTATSPLWASASSWYTDVDGTSVSSAAPTATDDVVFNTTPFNATNVVPRLNASASVNSLTFNSAGTVVIQSTSSASRELVIGAGGVTVASGAGTATIGNSSATISVRFGASQTWTNNSSTTLSIRNNAASAANAGNVVLTLNAASTGNIQNQGATNDGTNSTLAVVVDSAGSGTALLAGGNFSGGTTIKRGVLQISSSAGVGAIQIGDTSGSSNARLSISGTTTNIANNIVVAAGGSGSKLLAVVNSAATQTLSGNVTLNDSLTIGTSLSSGTSPTLNISGVVSGAGDLTLSSTPFGGNRTVGLTLSGVNTYSGDTLVTAGSLTLADNAALTFYIGANGVNNQVSGAGTNLATFNGDFIFDLSGASLIDGNQWQIVDTGTLNESFASTFLVQGFDDGDNDNIWTNGSGFSFSEATGVLSFAAIPEPSAFALAGGFAALAGAALRRRRVAR